MTSDAEYHQWQLQGLEQEIDRLENEVLELKDKLSEFAWVPGDFDSIHALEDGFYFVARRDGKTWWMPLPLDPPQ